jgi:hypothetical protein
MGYIEGATADVSVAACVGCSCGCGGGWGGALLGCAVASSMNSRAAWIIHTISNPVVGTHPLERLAFDQRIGLGGGSSS